MKCVTVREIWKSARSTASLCTYSKTHNVALAAWAEIKGNHDKEFILLTLDHHTDVHEAFIGWAYHINNGVMDGVDALIEQRLAQVNVRDHQSVQDAIKELRNDEQIDAAVRLEIFRFAFCFNNQNTNTRSLEEQHFFDRWEPGTIPPQPPFSYEIPKRKIFEIGEMCAVECERMPHTDDCLKPAADQAIESVMLERLINTANQMARSANIEDCHPLAERWAGLAHGDPEQECPRGRLLRAGWRLSFSRGRSAATYYPRRQRG